MCQLQWPCRRRIPRVRALRTVAIALASRSPRCFGGRVARGRGGGASATWSLPRMRSASLVDRGVTPQVVSEVDLTRTGDFLLRVEQHFFQLGDPAAGAGNREQDR